MGQPKITEIEAQLGEGGIFKRTAAGNRWL